MALSVFNGTTDAVIRYENDREFKGSVGEQHQEISALYQTSCDIIKI